MAARKHPGASAEGGPAPVRVPSLVHLDGYSGSAPTDGLRIAVPYTTAREAKLALAQVSSIIAGLDACITVVVPVTVPWALPLSRPLVATDAWLRRLSRRLNVPCAQVQILRVLCRNPRSIWARALPGFDIVVCGCAPDSAAGKLLAMWNGDAMDVVFVPARPGGWLRRVADALRWACRFRSGDPHWRRLGDALSSARVPRPLAKHDRSDQRAGVPTNFVRGVGERPASSERSHRTE